MSIRYPQGRQLFAAGLLAFFTTVALAQTDGGDTVDSRLKAQVLALGFKDGELPQLKPAFGNYVDAVEVGNMLYLSSAAPQAPDGTFVKGRVPDQVSPEQAMIAAKLACLRQISRMKFVLGNLNRVKQVVYVRGKILSAPGYTEQTKITDACSALYVAVFGEKGKHARTTDGTFAAPFGVTVEVETTVELYPQTDVVTEKK
jgi:enamine deaminase RidA (YjgF/YER057c/UK114 family)